MQRGSVHILLGGIPICSSGGTSFISFKEEIHDIVTEANEPSDASAMGTPVCGPMQKKKSRT
jgi:hypothetical protein